MLGILLVSVVLLLISYVWKLLFGNSNYWPKMGIQLVGVSEIGSILERLTLPFNEFDKKIYDKFKKLNIPYGGIEEFGRKIFFVTDLKLIKNILVKDFDNFSNRGAFDSQQKIKYFRDMLLIKENEEWKELRSILSPTFTTSRMKILFEIFNVSGLKLNTFIKKELETSKLINLKDALSRYTFDVIASAAFGIESQVFTNEDSIWTKMGRRFMEDLNGPTGMLPIILLPKLASLFKVSLVNQKVAAYFVDRVKQVIDYRKTTKETRNDFLQLLINAQRKQNGTKTILTDEVVSAQCLMFFLAGFDTTFSILVFTCYELAMDLNVQTKVYTEVDKLLKENDQKLSYDNLNELKYLDQVISEVLRMYTSGIRSERRCNADYQIAGTNTIIPKGSIVAVPVWAIHHDEKYFPNPRKFDPERFSPENKADRDPCTYMPFGMGPRHCIGMRFALSEVKVAVAKLVHAFQLESCDQTISPMKLKKTAPMKPGSPLFLNFRPRCNIIDDIN